MSSEKDFFDEQIGSLTSLSAIYQYLKDNAGMMDADALFRSEYVLIVSTFDNYLHNIVRRKLREAFFNAQPLPSDFSLSMEVCQMLRNEPIELNQKQILDVALRRSLEKDSFQSPKSVEYALSLIKIKHIWKTASIATGKSAEHIKNQLALIVKRRNQIAHESDIDFATSSLRSISEQDVIECRNFLRELIEVIDTQIV